MKTIEGFFTHWKTSLFGILSGAANLAANGHSWQQILVSVALSLVGLFASDSNVTPINVSGSTKMLAFLLLPAFIIGNTGCWLSSGNNFQAVSAIAQSGADYVATVSDHSSDIGAINATFATVNADYSTWTANPSDSTLQKLQAEGQQASQTLTALFQGWGITDSNTLALLNLTIGEFNAVLDLIPVSAPSGTGAVQAKAIPASTSKPLTAAQFKKAFNAAAGKKAI